MQNAWMRVVRDLLNEYDTVVGARRDESMNMRSKTRVRHLRLKVHTPIHVSGILIVAHVDGADQVRIR